MLLPRSLVLLPLSLAAARPPGPQCKEVPSSSGWPSRSTWSGLNSTTGGNLLSALPPAIVCDKTSQYYSPGQCRVVGEEFMLASFHDADPVSVHWPNWQNDGCLPSALYNGSCNLAPFPKYTVNASTAEHVVEAAKFASAHNLRLSVKNTGHDYLGRSTSPELSLWTHHLKQIEIYESFQPKGCPSRSPIPAVKLGAGNEFYEIYTAAAEHDFVVAGGAEPSVGLGGWLTSGGHSPLGSVVGLGVDNVLEMEVVTPSGELLTVNECHHPDLFWAMRGGGGSTFGVMISAAMKTYPNEPAANFTMTFQSTEIEAKRNSNMNFWNLMADLYGDLIDWSDANINGYFTIAPVSAAHPPEIADPDNVSSHPQIRPKGQPMVLTFEGYGLKQSAMELQARLSGFEKRLNATIGVKGEITVSSVRKTTDFLSQKLGSTPAGVNNALSSRLWSKETLKNRKGLLNFLRKTDGNPVQGLLVSGPAVRDFGEPRSVSVTPAWRRTYIHTVTAVTWAYQNATEGEADQDYNTNVLAKESRALAPDMGCYLNESDRDEPDAHVAFWGDNYNRLLELKRRYDPQGVFWCIPCIGHEDWKIDVHTGSLCRVQ